VKPLVSVSVRLQRCALEIYEGLGYTMPDLCRVLCCLPRLHPFLASIPPSCWKSPSSWAV